jgi:1-acyl-sn-glycerol-3-phosphate acyltransferase
MYWLSKFNITIFVDMEKGNISYLKNILSALKRGYIVLVYPEGTRSRNGCMGEPKPGFVKIANFMNVPIVPICMHGTFNILPPHKIFPRFRRCEIFVGERLFVIKDNPEFKKCFDKDGHMTKLGNDEIAFRIMNKISKIGNHPWDKKLYPRLKDMGIDV